MNYKVAILIINYNTYEKTFECINAINEHTSGDYHIYVLDNGSSNESFKRLSDRYHNDVMVTLIKSKKNLGYARGNNLLVKTASSNGYSYGIIMNNDIVLLNNAIDLLIDSLKADNIIAAGPKIFDINGNLQLSAKYDKPNFFNYLIRETIMGKVFKKEYNKFTNFEKKADSMSKVYWLSGAIFSFNFKLFDSIDNFDEFTFLYCEEYILAEKALKANFDMIFVPEAEVLHYHGASTSKGANLFARDENLKSEIYLLKNYFCWSQSKIRIIFLIRILETIIFWRKEKNMIHLVKQYFDFGRNLLNY